MSEHVTIGAVENRMLEHIQRATDSGALRYAFATRETWPAKFDQVLNSEVVRYPAVWTAFGGCHEVETIARGRWRAKCSFGIVVAAENMRNEQSRRHGGSPAEPGSYQLAQDVFRLFAGQSIGLDIDPLMPMSILPVETADIEKLKLVSIYAVSFDTGIYFDTPVSLDDIEAFKTFHANWDPAPYGHVDADAEKPGVQIPDDRHAIGTDNIQLAQTEDA